MKCQILFSTKNKKNISKCCLLKFLPSMQSVLFLTQNDEVAFIAEVDFEGLDQPLCLYLCCLLAESFNFIDYFDKDECTG